MPYENSLFEGKDGENDESNTGEGDDAKSGTLNEGKQKLPTIGGGIDDKDKIGEGKKAVDIWIKKNR